MPTQRNLNLDFFISQKCLTKALISKYKKDCMLKNGKICQEFAKNQLFNDCINAPSSGDPDRKDTKRGGRR